MLTIGFANKYYTLWNVENEERFSTSLNGQHYLSSIVTRRTYYKNLSMNRDEAILKAKNENGATDIEVDPDLKGHTRSWATTKYIDYEYEAWQFRFGKYQYLDIRECKDDKYLHWYSYQVESPVAEKRLLELRDDLCRYKGQIREKTLVKTLKAYNRKLNKIISQGFIEGVMERNIDSDLDFMVDGLSVSCRDRGVPVKQFEYNGYEYYLPIIGGGARRVKGKVVRVDVKWNEDWNRLDASNFRLVP